MKTIADLCEIGINKNSDLVIRLAEIHRIAKKYG